jgi:putative endonuclease
MPFDFLPDSGFAQARRHRGARAHLSGLAAEEAVCRHYLAAGYDLVAVRKRCPEGEIDLLLRRGGQLVAVEVKCSATHDIANDHATPAQLRRVSLACERCMQDMAAEGVDDMRLDLVLVDAQSRIQVLEGLCLD